MSVYGFSWQLLLTNEVLPADFVGVTSGDSGTNATAYPTSFDFGGTPIDAGFTTVAGSARERSADTSIYRGLTQRSNGDTSFDTFRIDLPATGAYDISLAAGDQSFASDNYIRIYDNTTLVAELAGVATTSGSFADAQGTVFTQANHAASNVAVSHTFTTTTLFIEIGSTDSQSGDSKLAWLSLTGGAAPSASITNIDGDNNVQAGQTNVDIIMTATTGVTSVTLGGESLTINGVT